MSLKDAHPKANGGPTPSVYLVLPAYNEARGLEAIFSVVDDVLGPRFPGYRVIVVDGGSTDATANVVWRASKTLPVSLVSQQHRMGLASAIRAGFRCACNLGSDDAVVVTMDADNTHPIGLVPKMVDSIEAGHDVVVASRFRRLSRIHGVPLVRRLMSINAAIAFKLVFPIRGVYDYTSGYRAYRVSVIKQALELYGNDLFSEDGFSCMVDVLIKLRALQLRFAEVPLVLRYDRKFGPSKMRVGKTIRDSLWLAMKRRVGRFD